MTEGLINLVDDDSSRDLQPAAVTEEDRMETSRLSAHVPRPASSRAPQTSQGVVVPPPRPSYPTELPPSTGGAGALYPSEPPAALPRTSWWRSLIASTLAPPAREKEATERQIGRVCFGFALGLPLAALLVGARGAPADAAAPSVAVAIVIARAALALGLLAFGHALLRTSERFLGERRSGG